MSKTALIVALLVMLGLGVAALVMWPRNGKPAETGPLLSVEPAMATEVRMDFPDGSSQAVVRTERGWRVVIKGADGKERSWPASQTQVHAALRIFATVTPDQNADGTIDKPAGTLTIKGGGPSQTLKISGQRLAGRALVESAGRAAWVDANIAEMLITTGIQAWRDPAAFTGLGDSASVISISGQSGTTITLARTQGVWGVRQPFQEPADPAAVARLLTILSAVRIVDFCDKGPPAQTGLDKPLARLEIESGGVKWRLSVGTMADIAGRTVVAELAQGDAAPQVVILAGEHLAAISADPVQYVSKLAVRREADEISAVTITRAGGSCPRAEFRRTLERWESRCAGDWGPALQPDVSALESVIKLCTAIVPERLEPRAKREIPADAATLEIGTAGGTPLGRFTLAMTATHLQVATEHLVREYPLAAAEPLAEWLAKR